MVIFQTGFFLRVYAFKFQICFGGLGYVLRACLAVIRRSSKGFENLGLLAVIPSRKANHGLSGVRGVFGREKGFFPYLLIMASARECTNISLFGQL